MANKVNRPEQDRRVGGGSAAFDRSNSILYDDYFGTAEVGGTAGYIDVWMGSSWEKKPAKYWNGSSWEIKPVKHWNGSSWVTT